MCGRHVCVDGHCRCPVYFSGDATCTSVSSKPRYHAVNPECIGCDKEKSVRDVPIEAADCLWTRRLAGYADSSPHARGLEALLHSIHGRPIQEGIWGKLLCPRLQVVGQCIRLSKSAPTRESRHRCRVDFLTPPRALKKGPKRAPSCRKSITTTP